MRFRVRFWSTCRMIFSFCKMTWATELIHKMLHKMLFVENPPGLWKLHHKTPELFTRCYFQKQERVLGIWITYRLIFFLYYLATTVYTIADPNILAKDKHKYLIFLTNWSYLLQLIQYCFAFIIAVRRCSVEKKNPQLPPLQKTPCSYKIYWVLYLTSLPVSLSVTILFWSLIYDPVLYPVNAHNIIVHGTNSAATLLDFILVGFPIRIVYIIFPNVFTFLYILFNIIYYFAGGTGTKGLKPIYKVLDWSDPIKAINFCILGFILVNVIYTFLWIFSLVKEYFRRKGLQND